MFKVIIVNDENKEAASVKIIPKEGPYTNEWKNPLTALAKSGRPTTITVNFLDDDGIVLLPFHFWFQLRNSVYVITESPHLKNALEFIYKEKVIFLDG